MYRVCAPHAGPGTIIGLVVHVEPITELRDSSAVGNFHMGLWLALKLSKHLTTDTRSQLTTRTLPSRSSECLSAPATHLPAHPTAFLSLVSTSVSLLEDR